MNPLQKWRSRPVAMLEQMAGLAALGGLWYWWLGIAESTISQLLRSASVLFMMLAVLAFLVGRGRKRLATAGGSAWVALLLFAMSLAAGYFLLWWVPAISSLRGQVISMVLRFGAAFLLVATFWANLLGSLASQSGSAPTEVQSPAA